MAVPYNEIRKEIRVMLVDHDKDFVNEMVDLLQSYNYKVTTVDIASVAMSVLSKGKKNIDVMIINVNSPDLLSFQLLAQGLGLNIISLFVCDEHDAVIAKKALNEGAYLYLKKPLHEEFIKNLWQFVLREKIQNEKAGEGLEENFDQKNVGDADDICNNNIVGENNIPIIIEEQSNNIHEADVVSNKKYKMRKKRGRKSTKEINKIDSKSNANKAVRRNVYIEWTVDLHAKFMDAVHQLGEGKCFPLQILEVMNVPGIERLQVASHLQKCRNNNWRVSKEQKSIHHPSGQRSTSGSQQRSSRGKFGTMPRLQTNVPNLQQQKYHRDQTQRVPKFLLSQLNTDEIFTRGESSTQQQIYRPQLQVQPHNLCIDNPFNNTFLLTQNNVGGGKQQQHEILFGMLGSQGQQESIIGSTSYRPELAFNSEYQHTQNDYNLDLNAAQVSTYSHSAIMFGTNIGNATINELEAGNVNFQHYIGEPNMSDSNNIVTESYASFIEGSDSNEKENYASYFNFNNMDYLFQNLEPPSDNLPYEHGREFDHVYSDDQVSASI
ncbi:hypothetical protein K7X08_011713 [Anisodus acutangulus]|uniref:Response regulatory domain-containing protein n=1 Tax=Anisodus acutangulus TaxID=402998 RepID=A0A9Q1MK34_9SOLA|nr:hypothetical protein K7X08_011713 [Anisodus acutangulus]